MPDTEDLPIIYMVWAVKVKTWTSLGHWVIAIVNIYWAFTKCQGLCQCIKWIVYFNELYELNMRQRKCREVNLIFQNQIIRKQLGSDAKQLESPLLAESYILHFLIKLKKNGQSWPSHPLVMRPV